MTEGEMYGIGIADDEMLFRDGMALLIDSQKSMKCLVKASEGNDLIQQIRSLKDDQLHLILCDMEMPGLDGVDTTIALNKEFPNLSIIILSSHYDPVLIIKMIGLGASAYMPKNEKPEVFFQTILTVIEKGFCYNDFVMTAIRDQMKLGKKISGTNLTTRENEVLVGLCMQKTNKEIGKELFISTRTVEGHRNNLLEKTNSKNTAGLIIFAIEHGYFNVQAKWNKWT